MARARDVSVVNRPWNPIAYEAQAYAADCTNPQCFVSFGLGGAAPICRNLGTFAAFGQQVGAASTGQRNRAGLSLGAGGAVVESQIER
jgi:hypothetical protein